MSGSTTLFGWTSTINNIEAELAALQKDIRNVVFQSGSQTGGHVTIYSATTNTIEDSAIASSNIVTLAGTQTLTNKTLTAPVISTISNSGTLTLRTTTG